MSCFGVRIEHNNNKNVVNLNYKESVKKFLREIWIYKIILNQFLIKKK